MLKKLGRWLASGLGYLLYSLVTLGLCLWLLFPKDAVHRLLVQSLNAALPGAQWRVGSVSIALPLTVRLDRIDGYVRDDDTKPLIHIDQLTVMPDLGEAVRAQRLKAGYSLALAKGTIAGTLSMQDFKSGVRVEGTLQGVRLQELAALTRPLQRDVQGVLAGSFDGVIRSRPATVQELNAKVRVENGRLELKQPVLGNTALPFTQASATFALKGQRLQLTEGVVDSKLFAGAFAGEVQLKRNDFSGSTLAIKGNLEPRPELFKGVTGKAGVPQAVRMQFKDRPLPFRLSGELRAPAIHFEEFAVLLETLEKESK